MIKKWFKDGKNQIVAAVFMITIIIACAPLISRYCINGHDLEYHLLRIESLKEGIKIGRPFLKINTLFFGNAGYASSMFYPDFLLYIPALLRLLGVSINASYHIYVAVCIILCYGSAYFSIKGMTGSRYASMAAAVTLTLCQYHLDDIYIRSAVGEYTAFIFIPVVIYAVYNTVYEQMDKPYLFVIGYAGVLLSHTSSCIMCVAFGIMVLFFNFKRVFLNKKVFIRLIIASVITLLITCFYWLPMLEQFMNTSFYVSVPWMQPKDEAVDFIRIFGARFPSLGSVCILILIPRIFINKKDNNETISILSYSDMLILTGCLFTIIPCNILPWDRIGKYVSFIQFPWRFFIMGSCLFSMAAGLIFASFMGKEEGTVGSKSAVILMIVLLINGIFGLNAMNTGSQGYYDYSDDYYSFKPYTANVIAGEWLPEAVKDKDSLVDDSEHLILDDKTEADFTRTGNVIITEINGNYDHADVPFIYYKGYRAEYIKENGEKVIAVIDGKGKNGMCRVYLKDLGSGTLRVYYKDTTLTIAAIWISIISFALSITIFTKKRSGFKNGKSK